MVYALEELLSTDPAKKAKQRQAFDNVKQAACQVLLALHEKANHAQVSRRVMMAHCQSTDLDSILSKQDIYTAYPRHGEAKPLLTQEQEKKKMQAVIEQMSHLEVAMGAEIKPAAEIQHAIERRLLQVQGDLLEYNPL